MSAELVVRVPDDKILEDGNSIDAEVVVKITTDELGLGILTEEELVVGALTDEELGTDRALEENDGFRVGATLEEQGIDEEVGFGRIELDGIALQLPRPD